MKKTPVYLFCDPGHDDSFAILLATYNESIELLGITTSSGNQSLNKTTFNALKTLHFIGIDPNRVPVIPGREKPLFIEGKICPEIHGDSGLDVKSDCLISEDMFDVKQKEIINQNAIFHFYDILKNHYEKTNQKVTVLITGSMTDFALFLLTFGEKTAQLYIDEVVCMGGAIGIGNMSSSAEFNIMLDPHASQLVFNSGLKVTLSPIEVTHKILVTEKILEKIRNLKSNFSLLMIGLLCYFKDNYKNFFDMDDPPLHDPSTVAYVIDRTIFKSKFLRVDVETNENMCRGRTNVDLYKTTNSPPNVNVLFDLDVDKFWDLMIDAIIKADKKSPLNKLPSKL